MADRRKGPQGSRADDAAIPGKQDDWGQTEQGRDQRQGKGLPGNRGDGKGVREETSDEQMSV